ncbi:hypothetical protein ACFE04_009204 [Oxalis oulophora]
MALLNKFIVFTLIASFIQVSLAATYLVGDSDGWSSMGQVDYDEWSSRKSFHVGDIIEFDYNNQFHNVKQVTQEDFLQCIPTSPIATYTNGSDKILLATPGHYYFLCGYPGHCEAGQKVDILVKPVASRTLTPPSNPLPSSPSTPNLSPASSPTPNTATYLQSSELLIPLAFLIFAIL